MVKLDKPKPPKPHMIKGVPWAGNPKCPHYWALTGGTSCRLYGRKWMCESGCLCLPAIHRMAGEIAQFTKLKKLAKDHINADKEHLEAVMNARPAREQTLLKQKAERATDVLLETLCDLVRR